MSDTFQIATPASTEGSALAHLPAVADALTRAVEVLVSLKYEADRLAGSTAAKLPHPVLTFSHHGTTSSLEFMRACLPFLGTSEHPSVRMLVPARQVAGDSWRWKPHNVESENEEDLIAYLTDNARADRLDSDHAGYLAWPALGLVVAWEGKNRVALLQSRSVRWIPADVDLIAYPDASRIVRYTTYVGGREEIWAVLDGRYLERIPLHAAGSDVLTAYGVPLPAPWPFGHPAPHEVLGLFKGESHFRVDLSSLQQTSSSAYQRIVVSVSALAGLSARPVPALTAGVALLSGTVIAIECTGWLRLVAAMIASTVAGGFACWTLPLFTARRGWSRGE